ncbi:hypothetical protein ACFLTG_02250 [Chloroflexota bacterium]
MVLLSPWPQFISDVANKILAIPETADDIVFQKIVEVVAVGVEYILFPAFGGVLGYILGSLWTRKFD